MENSKKYHVDFILLKYLHWKKIACHIFEKFIMWALQLSMNMVYFMCKYHSQDPFFQFLKYHVDFENLKYVNQNMQVNNRGPSRFK